LTGAKPPVCLETDLNHLDQQVFQERCPVHKEQEHFLLVDVLLIDFCPNENTDPHPEIFPKPKQTRNS
jgi:hypothetical protein